MVCKSPISCGYPIFRSGWASPFLFYPSYRGGVAVHSDWDPERLESHDGSMVLLWQHGSHQYTPNVSINIPAPWILWVWLWCKLWSKLWWMTSKLSTCAIGIHWVWSNMLADMIQHETLQWLSDWVNMREWIWRDSHLQSKTSVRNLKSIR